MLLIAKYFHHKMFACLKYLYLGRQIYLITRPTYTCAHLWSTKESLAFEYFEKESMFCAEEKKKEKEKEENNWIRKMLPLRDNELGKTELLQPMDHRRLRWANIKFKSQQQSIWTTWMTDEKQAPLCLCSCFVVSSQVRWCSVSVATCDKCKSSGFKWSSLSSSSPHSLPSRTSSSSPSSPDLWQMQIEAGPSHRNRADRLRRSNSSRIFLGWTKERLSWVMFYTFPCSSFRQFMSISSWTSSHLHYICSDS